MGRGEVDPDERSLDTTRALTNNLRSVAIFRGAYASPRVVFGVSPNAVFGRDAPAPLPEEDAGAPRT